MCSKQSRKNKLEKNRLEKKNIQKILPNENSTDEWNCNDCNWILLDVGHKKVSEFVIEFNDEIFSIRQEWIDFMTMKSNAKLKVAISTCIEFLQIQKSFFLNSESMWKCKILEVASWRCCQWIRLIVCMVFTKQFKYISKNNQSILSIVRCCVNYQNSGVDGSINLKQQNTIANDLNNWNNKTLL